MGDLDTPSQRVDMPALPGFPEEIFLKEWDAKDWELSQLPEPEDGNPDAYYNAAISTRTNALDIVSGRLNQLALEHYRSFLSGIDDVSVIKSEITRTQDLCFNAKDALQTAMEIHVKNNIEVLRYHRRRQNLQKLHLHALAMEKAVFLKSKVEKLIELNDFRSAMELLKSSEEEQSLLRNLEAVKALKGDWREELREKMRDKQNNVLKDACFSFNAESFKMALIGFKVDNRMSDLCGSIQFYYAQSVETRTRAVLLSACMAKGSTNHSTLGDTSIDVLCSYIEGAELLPTIMQLCSELAAVMRGFCNMLQYKHQEAEDPNDPYSYAKIRQSLVEGKRPLWRNCQAKLCTLLEHMNFHGLVLSQVAQIYQTCNMMALLGEDFTREWAGDDETKILQSSVLSKAKSHLNSWRDTMFDTLMRTMQAEKWAQLNIEADKNAHLLSLAHELPSGMELCVNHPQARLYLQRPSDPHIPNPFCRKPKEDEKDDPNSSVSMAWIKLFGHSPKVDPNDLFALYCLNDTIVDKDVDPSLADDAEVGSSPYSRNPSQSVLSPTSPFSAASDSSASSGRRTFMSAVSPLASKPASPSPLASLAPLDTKSVKSDDSSDLNEPNGTLFTTSSLKIASVICGLMNLWAVMPRLTIDVVALMEQAIGIYIYTTFILFGQIGRDTYNPERDLNLPQPVLTRLLESKRIICERLGLSMDSFPVNVQGTFLHFQWNAHSVHCNDSAKNFAIVERLTGMLSFDALTRIHCLVMKKIAHLVEPREAQKYIHSAKSLMGYCRAMKDIAIYRVMHHLYIHDHYLTIIPAARWELKQTEDYPSPYVERVVSDMRQFSIKLNCLTAKYSQNGIRLPCEDKTMALMWKIALQNLWYVLVEGYSRIKRCNNQGRGQMKIDLKMISTAGERFSGFKNAGSSSEYVYDFINAGSFETREQHLEWLKKDPCKYSLKQLAGLVTLNCSKSLNRNELKDLFMEIQAFVTAAYPEETTAGFKTNKYNPYGQVIPLTLS